jgi:hypothetical protein
MEPQTGYVYWREGDAYLGYLSDHPDHWTQGRSLPDLEEHLRDIQSDLEGGLVADAVRRPQ